MDEGIFENVLAEVINRMEGTSFPDIFFENLLKRLESYDYDLQEGDAWEIAFCATKVENHIKTICNVAAVPERLQQIAIDRICGSFFGARFASGQLSIGSIDLGGGISQIKEGDTSVSFSGADSESGRFSAMLEALANSGDGDLLCYRKLLW